MKNTSVKLFSSTLSDACLHEITSFFLCNTLAEDDTPVTIDHLTNTKESGNILVSTEQQTENELKLSEVYTSNELSNSEKTNNLFNNACTQTIICFSHN